MKLSPAARVEVVALATRSAKRARVTITGTSMEPLLRAGMVIDVEPLAGPPRVGDILVFKSQTGLVAHRLIRDEHFAFRAFKGIVAQPPVIRPSSFVTSGDALPGRTELVPPHLVVGRVTAVWTSARADARRIDDAGYRRHGSFLARTRALRSLLVKSRVYLSTVLADPGTLAPPPAFAALMAATHYFERCEFADGIALLESLPQRAVVDMARRHHLSGLVSHWLDEAAKAGVIAPDELRDIFRRIRWTNALQANRVLTCVRDVRDRFAAANIPAIFLKGGARLASDEPYADLQFAGDLDVIVPADKADDALAALRCAGYRDLRAESQRANYRLLHHREPLWSPDVDVPVEIHVTLATPAAVSQRLDYAALAPFVRSVNGPAGTVQILDNVASAIHLAYHARDLHVWRDIVLLSRLLRGLDPSEREIFDGHIRRERRDGLRLASAVAAAAAIAADGPPLHRAVRSYLNWAKFREDLPQRFAHVEFLEAVFGRCPIHILRLDRSRRDFATVLRSWTANAILIPSIARLARWRTRQVSPNA